MPEPIVEEGAPIRIVDKRQEARDAAAAAKLEAEALGEEAASLQQGDHPISEETHLVVNRLERMQELQGIGHTRDLTDSEKAELLRLQAEEEESRQEEAAQAGLDVRVAFMVIVDHDGRAWATTDTEQVLSVDRLPTVDDMYAAVCIVKRDIEASTSARHVTGQLRQTAQAAMQAQETVRSRLATPPAPARRR